MSPRAGLTPCQCFSYRGEKHAAPRGVPIASPLLLVTAAALLTTAFLFARVASISGRRRYSEENRLAGIAFTLAWIALATKATFDGARTLIPFFGGEETILWLTFTRFVILSTALMIWGFGYYVGFLWSGKARFSLPLGLFAASHAVFFLYIIERSQQLSVVEGTWTVRINEAAPALPPAMGLSILLLFFLPILVIAGAYLILAFRLPDRVQRLRAASVAVAVVIYQAAGIYLAAPQADPSSILNPIMVAIVLGASVLTYTTYRKPGKLSRRDPETQDDPVEHGAW